MDQHLSLTSDREGRERTSHGENRTWENRLSGIAGRLWETQAMEELGTHSAIERAEMVTLLLRCCAPSFYPDIFNS